MLRRSSESRKAPRKQRDAKRGHGAGGAGGAGRPKSASTGTDSTRSFVLYVEGARDREILACWARRIDRDLARVIERNAVILGGRQPARAVTDFRKRGGAEAGMRGLVVLDRDDHGDADAPAPLRAAAGSVLRDPDALAGTATRCLPVSDSPRRPSAAAFGNGVPIEHEEGLEVFVWSRRHIESYLLVPSALRRLLGLDAGDRRIERFVDDAEHGPDALHAKRILGAGGSLSEVLGAELRAGEIARAMRSDEFHPDIFDLFARIGRAVGLSQAGPEVVVRVRSTT